MLRELSLYPLTLTHWITLTNFRDFTPFPMFRIYLGTSNTRYGWVVSPYPKGTFTLQETPSSLSALTTWASPAPRLRGNHLQLKSTSKARFTAADQPRKRRRVEAPVRRTLMAYAPLPPVAGTPSVQVAWSCSGRRRHRARCLSLSQLVWMLNRKRLLLPRQPCRHK